MKTQNLLELKMTPSILDKNAEELGTKVLVGFEFEMFAHPDSKMWRGSVPDNVKTFRVEDIENVSELIFNFNIGYNLYNRSIGSKFDRWYELEAHDWAVDNSTSDDPDSYNIAYHKWILENDKDSMWLKWVKYEYDSVKSLIKTLDLEPNYGWKIPFEEFYLEKTDKPKPDRMKIYSLVKTSLENEFNVNVNVSPEHNIEKKEIYSWYVEPDASIIENLDDGSCDIEVVTHPAFLKNGLIWMDKMLKWMKRNEMSTGNDTGLHINLSIDSMEKFDALKFILFMGEKYLLQVWERSDSFFTKSHINALIKKMGSMDNIHDNLVNAIVSGKFVNTEFDSIIQEINTMLKDEKYMSINLKKLKQGYIEVRIPGGDYKEKFNLISASIKRLAYCLNIATDSNIFRDEYARKVSKLLSSISSDVQKNASVNIPNKLIPLWKRATPQLRSYIVDFFNNPTKANAENIFANINDKRYSDLPTESEAYLKYLSRKFELKTYKNI